MEHDSSRRSFLRSSVFAGAGAASFLAMGASSFAQQLSDSQRRALGWEGLSLPPDAMDGPWRNMRAVREKRVIDIHCHPYETRDQGSDYAETREQHEKADWVDFADEMVASMDRHGIATGIVNPAWDTYETILETSFKRHPERFVLSAGFPTNETLARGGDENMSPEEVAEILRKMIAEDGAVMIDRRDRRWITAQLVAPGSQTHHRCHSRA